MSEISFHGANYWTKILLSYLHSPDHPMKTRIFQSIAKKIFPHGILVKNHFGTNLYVQPDEYIGWSILYTGGYEENTLNLGKKLLENGGNFLDIGANFGLFTCTLGGIPGVRSYSIEPFAKEFIKLQKNLSINPRINAQLFNVALDSSHGLLKIEDFKAGNSGTVRILLDDEQVDSRRHAISAVTLQSLLVYAQVSNVTLLKIDVEGYELPVLEGLDWESPLRPRHIITEFTDYSSRAKGVGRKSLWEFLTARGYEGFTVHGQPLSLEQSMPEDNAWFQDVNYMG